MNRWILGVWLVAAVGWGCGGDDDGGTDTDGAPGVLTVVNQTPASDQDNVWIGDPIEIEFSDAVAPSTVADNIEVADQDGPVSFTSSVDGSRIVIELGATPDLPATLTVTVGDGLRGAGGQTFAGASWSFSMPLWVQLDPPAHSPQGAIEVARTNGESLPVAFLQSGQPVVLLQRGRSFTDVSPPAVAEAAGDLRVTGAGTGQLILALTRTGAIDVMSYDGSWTDVATATVTGPATPFDVAGADSPVLASLDAQGDIEVRSWSGSTWTALGSPIATSAQVTGLALATLDQGSHVLAYTDESGALWVHRYSGDAWETMGGQALVDPLAIGSSSASDPHVVGRNSVVAVSWTEREGNEWQVRSSMFDGTSWATTTEDAELVDHAREARLFLGDGNRIFAIWREQSHSSSDVLVAVHDQGRSVLASPANQGEEASHPTVAVVQGQLMALWKDGDDMLAAALWNHPPSPPPALPARPSGGSCVIDDPPAGDLADTGCYADVAGHRVAGELIPYALRSPLWSDGAIKRRYVLVPDSETIDYTAEGAWGMPIGTIVLKEFWLEQIPGRADSRFPVESRFLVKRCEEGDCLEPWQGYSYQWNTAGTGATLLTGNSEVRVDWQVEDAGGGTQTHGHIYPSRFQCTRCHNAPAGRVLGLQTAQLNRLGRFGDRLGDQLVTFDSIGLFSAESRPESLASVSALPWSRDRIEPIAGRARSYLHANCSQCHRREPDGERPTIDFRFTAALADDNICNQVTPGDGEGSTIYLRDSTRGDGQMPPLATDQADDIMLQVTAAWIEQMAECPPPAQE